MKNVTAIILFLSCLYIPSTAQEGCPVAPPIHPVQGNIFSTRQIVDLGDIVAEREEINFSVVADDALNARLQAVGDRIVKVLPADMPIRFRLIDLPVVNAFTMPGGRIYVTRKLVAFARSEDELAGILAHEVGHVLTRDAELTMSQLFQRVLGVTSVGDKADIFEKYNRLLNNERRKQVNLPDHEDQEQLNADQVAVYAMARAGYDPKAYVEAWDRLAETKGSTGSWFTDLFGSTKPGAKRLREALKAVGSMPKQCIGAPAKDAEFQKWRAAVIEYSPGKNEQIPGLIAHKKIAPPLRADINHLRFSPDGKYILAQDDSTIFVLKRDPLSVLFHIDAPDAYDARFTPDSTGIAFYDSKLRVERWDVEQQKRVSVNELALTYSCIQSELHPEGKYVACLDAELDLRVIDAATGEIVFEKKKFYEPDPSDFFVLFLARLSDSGNLGLLSMEFSPDGKYLAAARHAYTIAIDLGTMKQINLSGKIKDLMWRRFTFTASGNLVGVAGFKDEKSAMLSFPAGEVIQKNIPLGGRYLKGGTKGDYLIIRPLTEYAAGIFDIKQNRIVMGFENRAVDTYENICVFEQRNGELQLRVIGDQKQALARVQLPESSLGRLRAVDINPDLQVVAFSQRSRGAVWNLAANQRLAYVRGFDGAWVGERGHLYADFPEKDEVKRSIVDMDFATRDMHPIYKEEEEAHENGRVWQEGSYLLMLKPIKGDSTRKNCNLEVRDVRTNDLLWTQPFPRDVPGISVNHALGTMIFGWDARSGYVKEQVNADPALKSRYEALKDKERAGVFAVVDANSGKKLGSVVVDTGKGSFRPDQVTAVGDWLLVGDNRNRVLLYSISSGEQKSVYFGHTSAISPKADLLLLQNEPGQISAYSLTSMQKVQDYQFPARVSWMRFSSDGKRAFVLTRDQNVYWLDMTATKKTSSGGGGL